MEQTNLLDHLLQSSLALTLLYALYWLLLKHGLHFRFNRAFILVSLVLSAVLPWIKLPVEPAFAPLMPAFVLSEATISPIAQADNSFWNYFTIPGVLTGVYALGAAALLIRLLLQLLNLWRWKRRLPSEPKANYQLIRTGGALPTFSFFRWLFWDENQPLAEKETELILAHECTHMRQWHSVDVLVLEFFKILFWFHPAVYGFQKAQRAIHEYLADQTAIQSSSPDLYLKLLAHSLLKKLEVQLAQSFYQSPLKNRMKMIHLSQTAKPTVWKAAASHILAAAIIVLYACRSQDGISPSGKALTEVDQMPVYEGGLEAFNRELLTTILYPASARKDAIQGEVIIAYTVTKNGALKNIDIVKGVREDLDQEVKRALTALKNKWLPGKKANKITSVRMSLPVNFVLDGKRSKTGGTNKNALVVIGYLPEKDRQIGTDDVFVAVEQMPQFAGGMEGMMKYLSENIKYPEKSFKNGVYGKVFVSFVVREDGGITDAEVAKGVNEEIDAEALRVIKAMPKWIPGMQSGKKVPVRYSIPIAFAL